MFCAWPAGPGPLTLVAGDGEGLRMREATWLKCGDPARMLDFLQDRSSPRKALLYSAACCRAVWDLLTPPRVREAVEVAERLADGQASAEEGRRVGRDAWAAAGRLWRYNRRTEEAP